MSIIINQISYIHPDKETLFENISFSVNKGNKIALIGDNGTGKSTLLQAITGNLPLASGEIVTSDTPYYVPQHFGQYDEMTIAQVLNIDDKIQALHAIMQGDTSTGNFTLLDDDWTIEERVADVFSQWGIKHLSLSQKMKEISGGEKTKVFLSGILIHSPSIILLDEPSNHLDLDSRTQLYEFIESTKATLVVVSHDRTLLNLLDFMYELQKDKVIIYGGNYEFYKTQKEEQLNALGNQLHEKEKALRLANKIARETAERKQKHESRGKKQSAQKGIPRIALKTLKDNAEKSSSRLQDSHIEKQENLKDDLKQLRKKMPETNELKLMFENANLHNGKTLVDIENINFKYNDLFLWKNPLNFHLRSGDRIVISGKNGAGKTTLLRIILGELSPIAGTIKRSDFSYLYIDQQYSIINNQLTILEQVQAFNKRNLPEHELKTLLHRFLFPHSSWDKKCEKLSGGEKMKLVFCCLIAANNVPDVFMLDEPTNNLDITSLEIITSSIREYKGTILLISHDTYFINEIGITHCFDLTKNKIDCYE